jgi:hypothetical protein
VNIVSMLSGTLRQNVSLVQKSHRTSIERSFFAECPGVIKARTPRKMSESGILVVRFLELIAKIGILIGMNH